MKPIHNLLQTFIGNRLVVFIISKIQNETNSQRIIKQSFFAFYLSLLLNSRDLTYLERQKLTKQVRASL